MTYVFVCACVRACVEINSNKRVYRQSQVQKPTGSEVEWAESRTISDEFVHGRRSSLSECLMS